MMSESSTEILRSLESVGAWAEIALRFASRSGQDRRWKASVALASSFTGDSFRAAQLIEELRREGAGGFEPDAEVLVLTLLAQAALARRCRDWEKAKFSALRALVISRRHHRPELEADALFAVALCLSNMGRHFLAVELYRRLRDQRGATLYRKKLAAVNEAYALWDLGQWRRMHGLLEEVPVEYGPRLKLMLALLELNPRVAIELLQKEPKTTIKAERRNLVLFILEACAVFGPEVRSLTNGSWIERVVAEMDAQEGISFWSDALRCLQNGGDIAPPTEIAKMDWRTSLEALFLGFLSRLERMNASEALTFYSGHIEPRVQAQALSTPLIPTLAGIRAADTKWSGMLAQRLGLLGCQRAATALRAHLGGRCLMLVRGEREVGRLDFHRRDVSYRALQIIAGREGQETSKRLIHEHLTGTRYAAALHDQRIQKLFKRLEREIRMLCGESLWCWPGTNSIRLLRRISNET
ncbi:MAG: hypothetical protein AB7G93_03925 [Bdellovibrionales bacterium]